MQSTKELQAIFDNVANVVGQQSQNLDLARDSYRFHRYPVNIPWGAIWTGRKR